MGEMLSCGVREEGEEEGILVVYEWHAAQRSIH